MYYFCLLGFQELDSEIFEPPTFYNSAPAKYMLQVFFLSMTGFANFVSHYFYVVEMFVEVVARKWFTAALPSLLAHFQKFQKLVASDKPTMNM